MKLCFVGDLFISRRITPVEMAGMSPIIKLIGEHDVRFGNLETALLDVDEGTPALFPGGGYAMAEPECLDDLKEMGFNLLNAATNHAMDYGESGCLRTIDVLRDRGVTFAGIGQDLEHASAPAYLNVGNERVALISVTSSFHDSYAAGPSNCDVKGRPGVSPLRHKAIYSLPPDQFAALKKIAADTGINAYHDKARRQGYLQDEEWFKFGSFNFKVGDVAGVETNPLDEDLNRTLVKIMEARRRSDIQIVSIHSHQFKGNDSKVPPDFITLFAKSCVIAGARIVVCHGPHILRCIERFKDGIILYGVGNFIFQNEQQKVVPEDFYWKYGLSRETCSGPMDAFRKRSKNGTVGIVASMEEWHSAIFSVTLADGKIECRQYPIEISKVTGLPSLSVEVEKL